MSETPSAKALYDGIAATADKRHDTLYCTEEQFTKLWEEATYGMNTLDSVGSHKPDEFRIHGLTVQTFEQLTLPIVCQRGDVFPLAKDWKDE